jgi:cobalt-zinc-cadmium efflux system outer membrane protein
VFDQTVHTFFIGGIVDVWAKRSARLYAAGRGLERRRLLVADALREIAWAVRTAFAEILRERSELDLARETRARYDETIRISRARREAGDISEAELRKIELEGLRYRNAEIDGDMELDLARQKLAALLALAPSAPIDPAAEPAAARAPLALPALTDRALAERPDLAAARAGRAAAEASLAQARREALPDISLGVGFTHSEFTVSGDNPNALALGLSLPLPVFDRNQANIGRAALDIRRADNEAERLSIQIRHEVADAVRRATRAGALLDVFEGGGMLDRADTALRVAERSYQAGSLSLLELLEAQRTFIETRAQYLRAAHDYRQSLVDVAHAVGENTK